MDNIPDIYTDAVSIFISDWGITLELRASEPPPPPLPGAPAPTEPVMVLPVLRARVRMSHVHAKALVLILKRQIKGWEQQVGAIPLPARVVESLALAEGEW